MAWNISYIHTYNVSALLNEFYFYIFLIYCKRILSVKWDYICCFDGYAIKATINQVKNNAKNAH